MMQDFVKPILALSLICLFMAGALALVNGATQPIIVAAAAERAEAARRDIIPHADDFVLVEHADFAASIIEAYSTTNNVGHIFIVAVRGYGGEMRVIIGVDSNGGIIRSLVLSHAETVGLGTRVFDMAASMEAGGGSLLDIDTIAGSTITTDAYQLALQEALSAFELLR